MIVNLDKKERDLLVTELEKTTIPELKVLIASGMRKELRDELKQDHAALKNVIGKLKLRARPRWIDRQLKMEEFYMYAFLFLVRPSGGRQLKGQTYGQTKL